MKNSYELETVGEIPRSEDERLEEIAEMPDEKVASLYLAASVDKVRCGECGGVTWLIGASGHNSVDDCHHCGEEYQVVG